MQIHPERPPASRTFARAKGLQVAGFHPARSRKIPGVDLVDYCGAILIASAGTAAMPVLALKGAGAISLPCRSATSRPRMAPLAVDLPEHLSNSTAPEPDRVMADVDAALVLQVLDALGKTDVHHHRQADDLRARLEMAKRGAISVGKAKQPPRPAQAGLL
jgi:hypothetical protein